MCFFDARFFRRACFGLIGVVLLGGLIGCRTSSADKVEPLPPRFYLEQQYSASQRARSVVLPQSGVKVLVDSIPVLVEEDFTAVDLMRVELGLCVRFTLKRMAARALYQISVEQRGSRLVLVLGGQAVGVRVIDDVFADGYLFTFLEVPDAELPKLVDAMRAALKQRKL